MPELYVGTVPIGAVVFAIVQAVKTAGMPGKFAPWLNAVLSLAFYLGVQYAQGKLDMSKPLDIIVNALVIFLSAAGFYTTTKFALEKPGEPA